MSRIVGTVTRTTPNTIISAQQTAQGNRAAFSASAGGISLGGSFRSASEAQRAVQSQLGGSLPRWTRQDMPGRIEHYVGRTGRDDPLEIYGPDLRLWSEADAGVIFVGTGPPDVTLLGDRSGNRNNLSSVATFEPVLVASSFGGLPTLEFTGSDRMTTSLALDPTQSLTITLLAAPSGAAVDRLLAEITGTPLQLFVAAGGTWEVATDAASIGGAAAPNDVAAVVQVTFVPGPPTQVQLFVNNVSVGVSAGSFAAGTFRVSNAADPWAGRVSSAVVALDADEAKRVQAYRYFMDRYNTP